jgi:hypothetical protein
MSLYQFFYINTFSQCKKFIANGCDVWAFPIGLMNPRDVDIMMFIGERIGKCMLGDQHYEI